MSREAEPEPVTDLFGMPLGNSRGELVPTNDDHRRDLAVPRGKTVEPESIAGPSQSPNIGIEAESDPAVGQAHAAERDRLLGMCRSLRAAHRCPGRCVLTGELRQGGMTAFRDIVDGSP